MDRRADVARLPCRRGGSDRSSLWPLALVAEEPHAHVRLPPHRLSTIGGVAEFRLRRVQATPQAAPIVGLEAMDHNPQGLFDVDPKVGRGPETAMAKPANIDAANGLV